MAYWSKAAWASIMSWWRRDRGEESELVAQRQRRGVRAGGWRRGRGEELLSGSLGRTSSGGMSEGREGRCEAESKAKRRVPGRKCAETGGESS
eukprot:1340071-Rhodomonas_salina.3